MTKRIKVALLIVIILSAILRLYKLDKVPPALSWDEVAVGYNAYTIANWGRDEWGKFFPLTFKSFEDDKHPIHVYLTAISVRVLGLTEFSTRFPSALFGTLNVIVVFFLAQKIFGSYLVSLFAAIFLAISPYNLQFSRFNHEANFVVFFFMLGLLFFFKGIRNQRIFLPWSFLSLGISLLSYHSAKVVVPPIILILIIFFWKDLLKIKKHLFIAILFMLAVLSLMVWDRSLLGGARMQQTSLRFERVVDTLAYKKTGNELLGRMEVVFRQYLWHFDPQYLFISGSSNSKFSIQTVGQFFKSDALFLIAGFIGLVWGIFLKSNNRKTLLTLLLWALLSPLPSSMAEEAPHAARASFQMASWILISAYGFYLLIKLFKTKFLQKAVLISGLMVIFLLFKIYLADFYENYSLKHSTNWQYGMKEAVEYVKEYSEYNQVYVTDIRSQPYIFFLYYLNTPLPDFLNSVIYTKDTEIRKYSLVSIFDKYYFGGWDPIESLPYPGVLYVLSPSQYDGLRHRSEFAVKKVIHFPDGGDAFFLISAK